MRLVVYFFLRYWRYTATDERRLRMSWPMVFVCAVVVTVNAVTAVACGVLPLVVLPVVAVLWCVFVAVLMWRVAR